MKLVVLKIEKFLRTFRPASLGLPVIVARADLLVTIRPWRHAQAFRATLLAEEHARLLVRCFCTPSCASRSTLLRPQAALGDTIHLVVAL